MSQAEIEAALKAPAPVLPEPLALSPLQAGILDEITRLKAVEKDPQQSALLDALGALYGGELAGPYWLNGDAFNTQARRAEIEIARADEYAIDPSQFKVPDLTAADLASLAAGEVRMSLAVMAYAREAYGARIDPNSISLWLDHIPQVPEAADVLPRVSTSSDPGAELRKLHPSNPEFEHLRQAYLVQTGKRDGLPAKLPVQIPDGPPLKIGDDHPDVALVRERLNVPAPSGVAPTKFDKELGEEIRSFLRDAGKRGRREINAEVRTLLNARQPAPKLPDLQTIQANMLRWRWLPRDLGETHIWNNIPEFETRLVKDGKAIHQERIIVGEAEQQTPIFSDRMEKIVFKPQWGVPNSIKITDLLPKLREGDHDILHRRGMSIMKDGRRIEPDKIRWATTDIRYLNIVQGPGDGNPLGELKFMFPNRHSVYMHDTTSKGLFQSKERTFSHGCIRVRNPRRLAEFIFTEVQGWDAKRIPELLAGRAEENNEIQLEKPIPVHNVYFTLVSDGNGGFRKLKDVYGHDRRVADALAGKSLQSIADNDPARLHKKRVEEIERSTRNENYSDEFGRRSSHARTRNTDPSEEMSIYRSALGAAAVAPPARYFRRESSGPSFSGYSSGRSRTIKPAWPPTFAYSGD